LPVKVVGFTFTAHDPRGSAMAGVVRAREMSTPLKSERIQRFVAEIGGRSVKVNSERFEQIPVGVPAIADMFAPDQQKDGPWNR
jgi:hypothetical protein